MTHTIAGNARHDEVRARAFDDLRRFEVVMEGHFDYGNGFHGRLYLNPHQLFQYPSTIWRVAQDLIDLMPADLVEQTQIVAGPATGGALLAHTMAGLLDGRRPMTHPAYSFAPFGDEEGMPVGWVEMMREAVISTLVAFSSHRMVAEYSSLAYFPMGGITQAGDA